jgi:hypothetical protein
MGSSHTGRQLLHGLLLAGEHEIGDGEAANDRHYSVGPPKTARDADGEACSDEIWAESEKAVDDGREPHRDRAEKHRHHRVPENQRRLARKENPARGVEKAEQREQRNIHDPQSRRDCAQARNCERKLVQGQRKRPGPHGHGETVRGEVAHDLQKRLRVPSGERLKWDVERAHRFFSCTQKSSLCG